MDGYEVYFKNVGPCPANVLRGTDDLDGSVKRLTLLGMQAYSTYNLTVTTMKNGGSSVSNIRVQTPAAGKTSKPSFWVTGSFHLSSH